MPGQDEQRPCREPAADAIEEPPRVDRELLRLRAGQQGAVAQRVQEPPFTDPPLLVDEDAVHDRDLSRRTPERLQRDQEPGAQRLSERHQVLVLVLR